MGCFGVVACVGRLVLQQLLVSLQPMAPLLHPAAGQAELLAGGGK